MDYSYTYDGADYKVPKNKIFECLYAVGEVCTVTDLRTVFTENNFLKASKLLCILGEFSGKVFDPLEVSKHYLYVDGGVMEIYKAIEGLVALLSPPESYNPPVVEASGKAKAAA